MYGIALSAAACLRAGTRADVAWLVDVEGMPVANWSEAVMFTPGGGRVGSLGGGFFDSQLADMSGRWEAGRLVDVELSNVDALIAGMQTGASGRCVIAPAHALPAEVWELAAGRQPFCLVAAMDGVEVTSFELYTGDSVGDSDEDVRQRFKAGAGSTVTEEGRVISMFRAIPEMAVVGGGPVAEAIANMGELVGWKTHLVTEASSATGVIAGFSPADKVVVAAHDVELAGPALLVALESAAGYIGSVGSRRMQETRADWLRYRGVDDFTRIHGPAGLDIGADTPGEIAVSVMAEAISQKDAGE